MNIEMVQGDDLRVFITVRDQARVPVDLTGASSIRWAVARNFGAAPLLEKELGTTITLSGDNAFYFDITAADSAALDPIGYKHEAEIVTATGLRYTTVQGSLKILPQILT